MTIEVPNLNDYEEVNKIAIQVQNLHVDWRPDLFLRTDEVISKEYFKSLIDNKYIFVAKEENEILGYVSIYISERQNPIMRYRKILDIDALGVDEKYRGRGIGTKLLEYIKELAKKENCTDLHLTVNEENAGAIKLYETFGFRVKNISYTMDLR